MLSRLVSVHGAPFFMRTDNGLEFVSHAILERVAEAGIATVLNDPGNPWQNGADESFNGKLRDECLSVERFRSRREAAVVIEAWRQHQDEVRPNSSLGYRTPAEFQQHNQLHQPAVFSEWSSRKRRAGQWDQGPIFGDNTAMLSKLYVCIAGASMMLLAIPLALNWVQPNGVFGWRTRHTLSDVRAWFAVNSTFGRCLLVTGAVTLLLGWLIPRQLWQNYDWVSLAVLLVPLALAIGVTLLITRNA